MIQDSATVLCLGYLINCSFQLRRSPFLYPQSCSLPPARPRRHKAVFGQRPKPLQLPSLGSAFQCPRRCKAGFGQRPNRLQLPPLGLISRREISAAGNNSFPAPSGKPPQLNIGFPGSVRETSLFRSFPAAAVSTKAPLGPSPRRPVGGRRPPLPAEGPPDPLTGEKWGRLSRRLGEDYNPGADPGLRRWRRAEGPTPASARRGTGVRPGPSPGWPGLPYPFPFPFPAAAVVPRRPASPS